MDTDNDTLTYEKLKTLFDSMKPVPKLPKWKDLSWAQRNMMEQTIRAIENQFVRESLWREYYRDED